MEELIDYSNLDGIFIKIFDPTGKADEHIFEDFLKSSIITDIEPNFYDKDHWINVLQSYPLYNVIQIDREPESDWIYFKPHIYSECERRNLKTCGAYACVTFNEKLAKKIRKELKAQKCLKQ